MRLRYWHAIGAALLAATWFAWSASIVAPTTGGTGGSATNAQPPSTVLSNIAASGLSLPYIALSTNSGAYNNVTSIVARSGIVVSNDSAGIASLHVTAGSGSQTPWTSDINGGGNDLTNVASVQIEGTGASIVSIRSYQGDRFALTRATNAPAGTGTTNDIQIAQGATAGQVLGVHANLSGQLVWTNMSAGGGITAGPDGAQLISLDGATQWLGAEDFFVQESFYSGAASGGGGTSQTTGGGSVSLTASPGAARLSSYPTNATSYGAWRYWPQTTSLVPWQSNLFIQAKLQIINSGDITNSEFSVGMYGAIGTLATTATIRWIGRGDWNPNWIAAVGVGSTYTYATTGLAIAHSTPYTLSIKGNTNSLGFYTNGVLFTTLTSNLPGGAALQPGVRSMATVSSGTADDNSMDVDFITVKAK